MPEEDPGSSKFRPAAVVESSKQTTGETLHRGCLEGEMPDEIDIDQLLRDAVAMADTARAIHGPHRSAEFAACRVAEEAGELVQAATSMTRGRDVGRRKRIVVEAIDSIAMIIRLLREFPDGVVK